ncbi:MAG TPA: molybdopterin dinucleotide binding domain-containing protein, partial [Terriglobales bacterium]|nr:molybdopterin dinucleotide binding domain-containing protein [Terriglobales bacterium]
VKIFNQRGAVTLKAHVNGSTRAGVVATHLNWAKLAEDGQSINALTSEKLTDIGRGATFYSTLVQVERA